MCTYRCNDFEIVRKEKATPQIFNLGLDTSWFIAKIILRNSNTNKNSKSVYITHTMCLYINIHMYTVKYAIQCFHNKIHINQPMVKFSGYAGYDQYIT